MKREELIHLICTPLVYISTEKIKSRRTQLKNLPKMIRIDEIIAFLKINPRMIEDWKKYSYEKQDRTGYYLIIGKEVAEFGFFDNDNGIRNAIYKSKEIELVVALFIIFDSKIHNTFFHIN